MEEVMKTIQGDLINHALILKNSLDTAFEEGIEKGLEIVAINGIKQGKSDETIIELTGLSLAQLAQLKEKIKESR
ncbi:hypothetical protein R9C00_24325 [Flammeovirgaceae bacterium SG7u.111]|nr:hypothetical protein [Flammeovirgaceae bacterium SG7u.132]WPO34829.1 hypothetical protein R9C00_24325 [Flammeovirgaceae bacterium SG7u.111]